MLSILRYSTIWPRIPRPVAASTMMQARKPSAANRPLVTCTARSQLDQQTELFRYEHDPFRLPTTISVLDLPTQVCTCQAYAATTASRVRAELCALNGVHKGSMPTVVGDANLLRLSPKLACTDWAQITSAMCTRAHMISRASMPVCYFK